MAGEALAGREEAERGAQQRAELAADRHREAERDFAERLEAAGFCSVTDYREARLPEAELALVPLMEIRVELVEEAVTQLLKETLHS